MKAINKYTQAPLKLCITALYKCVIIIIIIILSTSTKPVGVNIKEKC